MGSLASLGTRGVTLADVHGFDAGSDLCEALTATLYGFGLGVHGLGLRGLGFLVFRVEGLVFMGLSFLGFWGFGLGLSTHVNLREVSSMPP